MMKVDGRKSKKHLYYSASKSRKKEILMGNFIISSSLENFFQFIVTVQNKETASMYAFYLCDDLGTVLEKRHYQKEGNHTFFLKDTGIYHVVVYKRDTEGNILKKRSDYVNYVNPFSKGIVERKRVILYGLKRETYLVKRVLEKRYDVLGIVDPSLKHIGEFFFGLPILSINDLPKENFFFISSEKMKKKRNIQFEMYSLELGNSNIVMDTLHNISAIELYKISRDLYNNGFKVEANFITGYIKFQYNSYIPATAEIGEGTRLGYGGIGVVIHYQSVIGKNCVIAQNVTLGGKKPIIGDNVYISAGAKCIGGSIGSNVVVGANAVVTKDIPDNCVIAGVPAVIISKDIEKYAKYFK